MTDTPKTFDPPGECEASSSLPASLLPLDQSEGQHGTTMTTSGCSHLPESVCDCASRSNLFNNIEEVSSDRCPVLPEDTAIDGGPLFSDVILMSTKSDDPICRICHEDGSCESLLSPCACKGTMATVHKSCLETWLASSDTSKCELCHTELIIECQTRPLTEWLRDACPRSEKRKIFCYMVHFLFIASLVAVTFWLWFGEARHHEDSKPVALWLTVLSIHFVMFNFIKTKDLYHNLSYQYDNWKRTTQKVHLLIP